MAYKHGCMPLAEGGSQAHRWKVTFVVGDHVYYECQRKGCLAVRFRQPGEKPVMVRNRLGIITDDWQKLRRKRIEARIDDLRSQKQRIYVN